jgi:multicomponent Na+:H+ antiporter subunit A
VKAGIYLLARFSPILGDTAEWSYTLMVTGGVTMVYAGVHSLFRTDLKGVLAYSTIAALGILTFLIGLGTPEAFTAMTVFIIVHALYKAALFLITGIIDHETGTRDLTQLSGLKKVLLPVYIAGILAALSSAGLPFTVGFIGKDLIYEATLHTVGVFAIILTAVAVLTNICLVAAGFMAGVRPFTGKLPQRFEKVHMPSWKMWVPPVILSVAGIIFGCFPYLIGDHIISAIVSAAYEAGEIVHLKIWHGFNLVLILSLVTLAAGTVLYLLNKPSEAKLSFIERFNFLSPKNIYHGLASQLLKFSAGYTDTMHNGFLRSYIFKIILFAELLFIYELAIGGPIHFDFDKLSPITLYEGATVLFLLGGLYIILTTKSRLAAVIGTSVIGYAICLMFVYYSAPDLAITQFTIDTLTVVLFVFVLSIAALGVYSLLKLRLKSSEKE